MSRRATGADRAAIDDGPSDGDDAADLPQAGVLDVTHAELVDRIVVEYGVDRARAAEAADLYMRQLRRRTVFAED